MSLSNNGQLAIKTLKKLGVEVNETWSEKESEFGSCQFAISCKSYIGVDRYFDMNGDWIRESFVNGEFVNYHGVRQDIVEVLCEFELEFDFYDRGTLEVWDMLPEHKMIANLRHTPKPSDRPMSKKAFLAFKELARVGAPVWDFDSYSSTYDPKSLPNRAQFVMTCEPEIDHVFADHDAEEVKHYPETHGLHPKVFKIVSKHSLKSICHLHRFDDPKFCPKQLVVLIDENAKLNERGS